MYDFVVVGAGFYGCTFARAAAERGKKILLFERGEVGGLAHTYYDGQVQVHKHGPHILNTDSDEVWNFLQRFGKINHYRYHPRVCYKNKFYSFPINRMTLQQLKLDPVITALGLDTIVSDTDNFESYLIRKLGTKLYRTFFEHYTRKMWGMEPKTLPASIAQRIPVRLNLNDHYYTKKHVGIPQEGYSNLLQTMIDHPNIQLRHEVFLDHRWCYKDITKKTIYTGSIDEYFNYEFGLLSYRTLDIKTVHYPFDYLSSVAVNYTDDRPVTREICHNYWLPETVNKHKEYVITMETPRFTRCPKDTPMYPMRDISKATDHYNRYVALASMVPNVYFKGRLGEYTYRDMCPTVEAAWEFAKKVT
jgi:UDP-galactopyranose mutase